MFESLGRNGTLGFCTFGRAKKLAQFETEAEI